MPSNHLKLSLFILFLFLSASSLNAQSRLRARLGTSIPVNFFYSGDTFGEDAAVGLGLGAQYVRFFGERGFGWTIGLNFNYHNQKSSWEDSIAVIQRGGGVDYDIEFQNYINVPLSFGVYYERSLSEEVGLFATAGPVINFFKITDLDMDNGNRQSYKMETKYVNHLGTRIGGQVGVGVFFRRLSLSVEYVNAGKYRLNRIFHHSLTMVHFSEKIRAEGTHRISVEYLQVLLAIDLNDLKF